MPPFARGFLSALLATSVCYPLDTLRRQTQLAKAGASTLALVRTTLAADGVRGLYRGFLPNAVKNLPNKGIRLGVYDGVKRVMSASEAAYEDEARKAKKGKGKVGRK